MAGLTDQIRPSRLSRLEALSRVRADAVEGYLDTIAGDARAEDRFDPEPHRSLDAFLGTLESQRWEDVRLAVNRSVAAQDQVLLILSINMFVAAGLGILGLVLVRRWVLLPVEELKDATEALARGERDRPARVESDDELGQLAGAFNRMSSELSRMERQMIQRERLAAVGEMVSYVAHNIRNPLAGIRSSAELTRQKLAADSELSHHQQQIIDAVERFQRWLRQFEHSCSPLELRLEPTELGPLIDGVMAVFRPVAERRGVRVRRDGTACPASVNIDNSHFEQALTAVIGNAIEAVPDGGAVTIRTETNGDPTRWTLAIADNGPGIDSSLRDRIFKPTFTTKPAGQGLGLAMARKIVEWHGGQITCHSSPGEETVFRIAMPVTPPRSQPHG